AVPVVCMVAALLVAPLIRALDAQTGWTLLGFGPEGARALMGTLAASLLTLIIFAFSILLLTVQIVSGQLTPRLISRLLVRRFPKLTLGVFVFAYTYSLAALGHVEDHVRELPLLLAVLTSLASLVLFLYLIQNTGQEFRPISILTNVDVDTRRVIAALFPR